LADALFSAIDGKTDFFASSIVIVPNILMEQWLKSHWLRTQGEGVLMNVEFKTIADGLSDLVAQPNYRLIKRAALKKVILSILSCHEDILPEDLRSYYSDSPVKMNDVADALSALLLNYFKDDFQGIEGWEESYQRKIYEEVVAICKQHRFGTIEKPIVRKQGKGKIYLFGFIEMETVYRRLVDECPFVEEYRLEIDDKAEIDYSVCRAPSMVREVEALHSKICELLLQGARMPDFLVVAPSIGDYANAIARVFAQNDEEYPNIPYVIRRGNRVETDVTAGLTLLLKAAKRGFYTRKDFYEICSNPTIMKARGIDPDEIENWMTTIVALNVFRDHPYQNDWAYIRKRLLLSKLVSVNALDNVVTLKEGDYIPYTNIGFDDDSIVRFVALIDDLDSFIAAASEPGPLGPAKMDEIKAELDKWFSFGQGEVESNPIFARVISSISILKSLDVSSVPLDVFFYILLEDSGASSSQRGQAFSQGITFLDFDPDAIYGTKYVFFLGAASNQIPTPLRRSELDLRKEIKQKDLAKAFRLLYQNASDGFYVSFVYLDLKTEEEFYLSPVVTDFNKEKGKYQGTGIPKVPLDETRPYKELFTRREFSGKAYFNSLLNSHVGKKQAIVFDPPLPAFYESLSVTQVRDYLKEPLMAKSSRLFNRESELDEKIKEEWEPFDITPLDKSILTNRIIIDLARGSFSEEEARAKTKLGNMIPSVNKAHEDAAFDSAKAAAEDALEAYKSAVEGELEVID
jgi:exodeoxyribonuclease V gamma subunit